MGIGVFALVAALAGNPFSLGVAAGEITSNTAFLWGHATAGPVRLEVARDSRFSRIVLRRSSRAEARRDGTIHVQVGHLLPGRVYFYRFLRRRSASATVDSQPRRSRRAPSPCALRSREMPTRRRL